jgi:hypothetical protein
VLPTPAAAAISAIAEKEKLPGISQAEWEVTEAERKRLDEYQRIKMKREEEALRDIEKSQREAEKLRRELYRKEGFQE